MLTAPDLRREREEDAASIRKVLTSAFETPLEANLVERLRAEGAVTLALVAEVAGQVVGHIVFSPVVVGEEQRAALGLGPMAVVPEAQRRGIGAALVRAGLERCRALGHRAVFVLGHPEYYPRFDFVPAASIGCRFRDASFDPYFFVAELADGGVDGLLGDVRYSAAFDDA